MPNIAIRPDGRIQMLYSDALAPLLSEGEARISRASHVEPDALGGWSADMSPVGGPVLGSFTLRQTALDAEVEWLERNVL